MDIRKTFSARTILFSVLGLLLLLFIVGLGCYYSIPISTLSSYAAEARLNGDNGKALLLYRLVSFRASKFDFSSNYELGNLYKERGNYSSAKYYYLKAASNASAPASVFYQLSDLYLNCLPANQRNEFIKFMEERADARKNDENIRIVLADFYEKIGEKEKALEWFKKALELVPESQPIQDKIKALGG